VALRCTRMMVAVLPEASITPEKPSNSGLCSILFPTMSEHASSVQYIAVSEAVLEEWDKLFVLKDEYAPPHESPKETSDQSDGWMEQWVGGYGEVLRKRKMLCRHLSIPFIVVGWRSAENWLASRRRCRRSLNFGTDCRDGTVVSNLKCPFSIIRLGFIQMHATVAMSGDTIYGTVANSRYCSTH
jgi:hypothetical protein